MSYCAIVLFGEDGLPRMGPEFRNAWGGHARIWDALFERYLRTPERVSWLSHTDELWKLRDDPRLSGVDRRILLASFDRAVIRREHFAPFAADLREFVRDHPVPECVDHLPAWADFIKHCSSMAIAFYATSVGDNVWWEHPSEEDADPVPYNLHVGDNHFDPYDEQS